MNMKVKIRVMLPLAKERLGPQKQEMMIGVQSRCHVWVCDPMDCSMPTFSVLLPDFALSISQSLLKPMSIESEMSSNHLVLCHRLLLPSIFPTSGSFLMSQLFASGGRSTGVSASASVLPMNIQSWFPLEWAGWISLQSRGFSRVFCNTTVQKHQFFDLLSHPTLTSIHDYWKWCYSLCNFPHIYFPFDILGGRGEGRGKGYPQQCRKRKED